MPETTFARQLVPLDVPTEEQQAARYAPGCRGHAGAEVVEQTPAAEPLTLETRRRQAQDDEKRQHVEPGEDGGVSSQERGAQQQRGYRKPRSIRSRF